MKSEAEVQAEETRDLFCFSFLYEIQTWGILNVQYVQRIL